MVITFNKELIIPVFRGADNMALKALSKTTKDLGVLSPNIPFPEEFQGSTFSVLNLGMHGVESFISITNQLNSTLLGVQ